VRCLKLFSNAPPSSVKLHLTDKRTRQERPFYGERDAMLRRNLGEGINIRDQPINTRNLAGWLSGKSSKLLPPDVTF